jgi:hypothetical protein
MVLPRGDRIDACASDDIPLSLFYKEHFFGANIDLRHVRGLTRDAS